jgi:hypothetical protein
MKAFILSLLTAGALALSPSAAKADHWQPYHRGYYGHYRPGYGYRPYHYGHYRPYSYGSNYYRYPSYYYGYPYSHSYYGYPAYGLGYTGPNVSFWYGF